MKNILIVNNYEMSLTNGIGAYIKQLVNCLKFEEGIAISVIELYSCSEHFHIDIKDGVTHFYFPKFEIGVSLERVNRVVDIFLSLYVPDHKDNIFFFNYCPASNLMGMIKESHPLSKQLYIVHNMGWTTLFKGDDKEFEASFDEKGLPDKRVAFVYKEELQMCALADRIVCLCDDTYSVLESCYPSSRGKVICINSGLETSHDNLKEKEIIKKRLGLRADDIIILFVGRVNELKGAEVLIDAFKNIAEHLSECVLVMIGFVTNVNETLKQIYPFTSRILLTGELSRDEVSRWYHVADIGVIPSYTEQCSYVGLEMLSYGLPVVSSDGYGVRNMFKEGYNGLVAHISDRKNSRDFVGNLAKKMEEVINSKEIRIGIGEMNKKVFEKMYSLRVMKEKYLHLFEDL